MTVDPERSVLLALAAVEESRSGDGHGLPEAEEALHRAVTADRIELRVRGVGGALAWSPNGQVFVTEGPQSSGIVDIRDARTGASVRSFQGHDLDVTDITFNHDGTLMATTGADGAARVWDPATGEEQFSVERPSHGVDWKSLRLGRGVGTLVQPGRFLVRRRLARRGGWRRAHPGSRVRADRQRDRPRAGAGRDFVRPRWGPLRRGLERVPMRSCSMSSRAPELFSVTGHFRSLHDVAWSPDGSTNATAADDGSARLFSARGPGNSGSPSSVTGRPVGRRSPGSPDSRRLITASRRTARPRGGP